jgi:hypothetical protein
MASGERQRTPTPDIDELGLPDIFKKYNMATDLPHKKLKHQSISIKPQKSPANNNQPNDFWKSPMY